MYIVVPVLVSRAYGEVEAREAGVEPGKERTTEEVEFELERLLAPYDASTRLEIARRSSGGRAERVHVPNYGARFDFWEPDGDFIGVVGDGEKGSRVEHEIYVGAGRRGHGVIAAGGLRTDFFYGALVTPNGRYHDFSPSEPPEGGRRDGCGGRNLLRDPPGSQGGTGPGTG
jgi:hypothetical protein